jgi:hypothetical protein
MIKWSKKLRDQKPHLVVLAVPADVEAKDEESFIREYHTVVSNSIAFGQAEWDLLPILPSVTGPVAQDQLRRAELARRIIAGGDVACVDRKSDDRRPAREILLEWIRQCGARP